MILRDKLRKALGRKRTNGFLRADFVDLGSEAQLSRALRNLVDEGAVVKIGVGIYAKAKRSALSGKPMHDRQLPIVQRQYLPHDVLLMFLERRFPARHRALYAAFQRALALPEQFDIDIGTGDSTVTRTGKTTEID